MILTSRNYVSHSLAIMKLLSVIFLHHLFDFAYLSFAGNIFFFHWILKLYQKIAFRLLFRHDISALNVAGE